MHTPIVKAFSIVEIILIVLLLAILLAITALGFGTWQQRAASQSVRSDMQQAVGGLQDYKNFKNNYPPNLAGTGFAASPNVALKLSTNAPSIGVYENLEQDQNAQLFLNVCNANLFATPDNTTCSFQGNKIGTKIHTKGTKGSNSIWNSPIAQSELTIDCGDEQAACEQAVATMIDQFSAQGGEFPIEVPDKNVPLPEPTQVPNGPASRFCLEGRANDYPAIVYYVMNDAQHITAGECPNDPSLQYYQ
jgi:type II secretory pathway pseudopilin PulG